MTADIHGKTAAGFEAVRTAFEQNFATRGEVGAGVCVYVGGALVAELWGGHADQARTQPWESNTLVNVYSTTKGMTALCAQRLIDEGRLELDRPVAEYWPEFAAEGKQSLPVRWLLSHRAGLAAVREVLPGPTLYDWTAMCEALAAEEPWWTPGEAHGYHAMTFGWLVGELVRRIDGRSLGTYFREEVAQPLGADFHIGLPDVEHDRVGELSGFSPPDESVTPEELKLIQAVIADPNGLSARAFANPLPAPPGAIARSGVVRRSQVRTDTPRRAVWHGYTRLSPAEGHSTACPCSVPPASSVVARSSRPVWTRCSTSKPVSGKASCSGKTARSRASGRTRALLDIRVPAARSASSTRKRASALAM